MFCDETGRRVRTKKEILVISGHVRGGCRNIPKGEALEQKLFTIKDSQYWG